MGIRSGPFRPSMRRSWNLPVSCGTFFFRGSSTQRVRSPRTLRSSGHPETTQHSALGTRPVVRLGRKGYAPAGFLRKASLVRGRDSPRPPLVRCRPKTWSCSSFSKIAAARRPSVRPWRSRANACLTHGSGPRSASHRCRVKSDRVDPLSGEGPSRPAWSGSSSVRPEDPNTRERRVRMAYGNSRAARGGRKGAISWTIGRAV